MITVRSLMFGCVALSSCTGTRGDAPTPVDATPVSPVEVTQPSAPVPAQPGVDREPEPGTPRPKGVAPEGPIEKGTETPAQEVWSMPYPKGVVPPYPRLAGVIVRPQELAAERFAGPLGKLEECAAAPSECDYSVGVLGFHADGRVAVIEAPMLLGCGGEDDPLESWGRVGKPEALASAPKTRFKPGKGDTTGAGKALAFVKAQAQAGFTAPDNLVFMTEGKPVGISGVDELALLRAPLAGWLLHIADGELRLVDPGNKQAHALGPVRGAGEPSLVQVVIDPARQQLWATVAFNDGGHCSNLPVSVLHWPIPAGVLTAQ